MASSYGGRRGPNMSFEYLRSLSTIPADTAQDDSFIDDELEMFTNTTQFYDIDSGQTTDYSAAPVKPTSEQVSRSDDTLNSLDFIPDFNFPEFPSYSSPALPGNYADGVSLHPIQPSAPVYSAPGQQQQQQQQQPQQHAPFSQHHQTPSEEADGDSITMPGGQFGYDDVSRVAAEEDKRKRNTAASARFRIKKKQREAALERSAKDMTDKVTILEGRIQQLETENKWLKNMILEKNSAGGDDKKGVISKEASGELKAGVFKP